VNRRRKGKGRERFRRERKRKGLVVVMVLGSGVEGVQLDPVEVGGKDLRLLLLFFLNSWYHMRVSV
jgi:hypothetical protein